MSNLDELNLREVHYKIEELSYINSTARGSRYSGIVKKSAPRLHVLWKVPESYSSGPDTVSSHHCGDGPNDSV